MHSTLALWLALAIGAAGASEPEAYRVGERDVLQIQVYGEPDLSGDVTIDAQGRIFVPLAGAIEVQDLSPSEVAERLTERLADGYLVRPQVSVEVKEYRSRKVSVVGAVGKPVEYFLSGPTSLLELLARAGNIDAERSAREVRVRHASGETVTVRVEELLGGGAGDLSLSGGDVISVPEGQFVYVAGEVESPGAVVFWDGLTVTQALTKAGGPSETARLRGAYILRGGERVSVNLKRILEGREPDLALEPGDQLVLRQSPI